MSKQHEALSIQADLLTKITDISLSIENKITESFENDLFFMNEQLGTLKVLLGENNTAYKTTAELMEKIKLKIAANKDPAHFY